MSGLVVMHQSSGGIGQFVTTILCKAMQLPLPPALPIDAHLAGIIATVDARRALVIVAPPGAGKTTRIPPALARSGRTILLQPRRIAARNLARRIAAEQGWNLGHEVGWQIRQEKNFSTKTKLLIATEGVLTARLQRDPLLSEFQTIVLDEFHERSIHADLSLALAREAFRARDDLRIVVMSATLESGPVSRFLDDCPVIEVPGRLHPVEVRYRPEADLVDGVEEALRWGGGDILVFLPGAREIRDAASQLESLKQAQSLDVLPLHGGLTDEQQDAALRPSVSRKVILSTNIAETSLTVEGVRAVVDTGLQKTARYDSDRAVDRLVTERISLDSADQRAGRAGREGMGVAIRMWDSRDILQRQREPEIRRVDLSGPLLEILAWGGEPESFEWFERPSEVSLQHGLRLLGLLGAVNAGRITPQGQQLRKFPVHPRLASIVLAAGGSATAASAAAILSEARLQDFPRSGAATDSDVLSMTESMHLSSPAVKRLAVELQRLAQNLPADSSLDEPRRFLRAVLAGYPDRVAKRREPRSPRVLLASGHGAILGRDSGVIRSEYLVAVEVTSQPATSGASEALIRIASGIDKDWLEPTHRQLVHSIDASGTVRAREQIFYFELLLGVRDATPERGRTEELLEAALITRLEHDESVGTFRRRARFARLQIDLNQIAADAVKGRTRLPPGDPASLIPSSIRRTIDQLAPAALTVPSGRKVTLDYRDDGSVMASVKLQELFGLAETPRVGASGVPVTFSLLSPSGRPVQTTTDLRSFWETTYPIVRKELRGRYPKHPWPDDPWTARPTARTRRR